MFVLEMIRTNKLSNINIRNSVKIFKNEIFKQTLSARISSIN
jgi:hypothetical protein